MLSGSPRPGEANGGDSVVGEGLVMSRGFRVCRARGGVSSSSPAAAGTGRGRGRVWRRRGVTVRLKVLRAGPGRACTGEVARGQCASMACMRATRAASGRVLGARRPAIVAVELDSGGARAA
jgi:hypothetical protein